MLLGGLSFLSNIKIGSYDRILGILNISDFEIFVTVLA